MKARIIVPLLLTLLLSGCGGGEASQFEDVRQGLENADSLRYEAELTAELPDRTADFTLLLEKAGEEYSVEILQPELIAGIRARVKSGETQLEYDGAILDMGTLTDRGLCPMSALPFLTDALFTAHFDSAWTENGLLAVRLVPDDDTAITVWFSGDAPVNAEIAYKDNTVVFVTIHNWEVDKHEGAAEENMG